MLEIDVDGPMVRPMNISEFEKYSRHGFERFVESAAESSGESLETVKARVGNPPKAPGPDDLWMVIAQHKKNIGYLWVRIDRVNEEAFGYDIYLRPEFRNMGYGRDVMLKCGKILEKQGIERLKICVFTDNVSARHLYESLGFKEISLNAEKKQHTLELEF